MLSQNSYLTRVRELLQHPSACPGDLRSDLTGDVSAVLRGDMVRRACGSGDEQLLCARVGGNIAPGGEEIL